MSITKRTTVLIGMIHLSILVVCAGTFIKNYILFHFIIEMFCVIIASSIVFVAFLNYSLSKSNSLVNNIGTAYIFVAITDFFHALSYKGINIISAGANIPTQLWIVGRYIATFSFLIAFVWWNRKFNNIKTGIIYFIITAISLYTIFSTSYFPKCYIEGEGLTNFKIISEYLIIAICFINILLIYKNSKHIGKTKAKFLIVSFLFTAVSEAFFTLYIDVYGIFNGLGHLFKAISYVYICKAIFFENIKEPFEKASSNLGIDFMTGLYNRRYLDFEINNTLKNNNKNAALIVFDLDNLKMINDKMGHINGDKAILETADALKESFQGEGILIRTGGDEFLAIIIDLEKYKINNILLDFEESLKVRAKIHEIPLSVSYGMAEWEGEINIEDFRKLFKKADEVMYKNKERKKSKYK